MIQEDIVQNIGKKLTTDNVYLREFQENDALAYFQLYNNSLVKKYIPADMIPRDINASLRQIRSLFLRGRAYPYWAIAKIEDHTLIGSCGFVNQETYHKRIELAYDLHPDYWGNGIMHHALVACTKYAFETLRIQRLEAVTLQDNLNSIKTLMRIGMVHEGTLRSFKLFKGKMIDVESFSITLSDYKRIYKNAI